MWDTYKIFAAKMEEIVNDGEETNHRIIEQMFDGLLQMKRKRMKELEFGDAKEIRTEL